MSENTRGFTLIELMIVIAIIGILAAIAIPRFQAYKCKRDGGTNCDQVSNGYEICRSGYKFIRSSYKYGGYTQLLDDQGHGMKCTGSEN